MNRDQRFNVLLHEQDFVKLTDLADHCQISKGNAIRHAITFAHAMHCLNIPTCATGQRCPVPHIHAPITAQSVQPLIERKP